MNRLHTVSSGHDDEAPPGRHPNRPSPFEDAVAHWHRAFGEISAAAPVATDLQFRVLDWPPSAEALIGWPAQRALGFGLGSVLSLSRETVAALHDTVEAGHALNNVQLPARRLGGTRCQLACSLRVVRDDRGTPLGVAWSLRTMSDGQTESGPTNPGLGEAIWKQALTTLPFPFALVDAIGTVRFANETARELLGMEVGKPCCCDLCTEAGSNCKTNRAARSATPSYWEVEIGNRRLDMSAIPVAEVGEQPDFVACFGLPSEPHLSGELRKFFRAVDENLVGVVITDVGGYVEYANPRACDVLGSSPIELVNRRIQSFYSPAPHRDGEVAAPDLAQGSLEVQIARPDGSVRPVRVAITDIAGDDGSVCNWVVLIDDMSERRALETRERQLREQLAHAARLAAVGEIATMIAHEINQPLSSIANFGKGLLHRIRRGKVDETELRDSLEEIVRQVERAGSVVRNVRTLARRRSANTIWLDVNRLVEDALPSCYLLAQGTGWRIVAELGEKLPQVRADRSQIEQVLLNLVRNAIEASECLPNGERKVIIRTHGGSDGVVTIEVEDHAPMLPQPLVARLGEPFFTTKPGGLGLGLSISRTLLENHGSRLAIRALADQGKIFHFELRTCDEPD